MRAPFPTVQFPLEEKQRLVNRDEFGEIRSMLFRCAQYHSEPLVPTKSICQSVKLSSLLGWDGRSWGGEGGRVGRGRVLDGKVCETIRTLLGRTGWP